MNPHERIIIGQRIRDNAGKLRAVLPNNSVVIQAIDKYSRADSNSGCAGGRRKRLLRWLSEEVQRASPQEKEVMHNVIEGLPV